MIYDALCWKICVFQQTVVRVYYILNLLEKDMSNFLGQTFWGLRQESGLGCWTLYYSLDW